MDEREIARLMQLDFSEGTETFRDALLARCLDALRPENQMRELDDDDLDMLAAAGDPAAIGNATWLNDSPL